MCPDLVKEDATQSDAKGEKVAHWLHDIPPKARLESQLGYHSSLQQKVAGCGGERGADERCTLFRWRAANGVQMASPEGSPNETRCILVSLLLYDLVLLC